MASSMTYVEPALRRKKTKSVPWVAYVLIATVLVTILHFTVEPKLALAESGDDNTPYCLLIETGVEVVEEYPGQTEQMCGGSKEKKTTFEVFNSIVWAGTDFMRPQTI